MKALIALGAVAAALVLAGGTAASQPRNDVKNYQHVFVIMMENTGYQALVGNPNAPWINQAIAKYGVATNYYGVTHPSQPNYIAATSGATNGVNDDNDITVDVPNIVDQLESHGLTWDAYMEGIDPADKLAPTAPGAVGLYAIKHDPFALMTDIRGDAARMAHIKPYEDLASDLASGTVGNFVWISPDQCDDMHGGVFVQIPGRPETPCPYGDAVNNDAADVSLQHKADDFVRRTVQAIMASPAWTQNSAIFVTADENDFDATNPTVGDWEDASGCCDSPYVAAGDPRISPDWPGGVYGGGLVPAILITTHSHHPFVDSTPYNHYSLLATVEKMWKLGYLQNAGDRANVPTMDALFAH